MTTQTEAERLAEWLERRQMMMLQDRQAAAELRRLVTFNQQLMDEVERLQKREWVGLTAEEIIIMSRYDLEYAALIGEVQRKLKEKNK